MRTLAVWMLVLLVVGGCTGRKSSLLLERQARGPLEEERAVAKPVDWSLEPKMQTLVKDGVEVFVNHASREYLTNFFKNKKIFGPYAGQSPYFQEHLVFYVKIANQSGKRIRINPSAFVLVDDRGNQYSSISTDYVTAFADFRSPVGTTTRGMISDARPGYFGIGIPVGKVVGSKPQGRFALLKQSALQQGYMYPRVVHDGLVAFWNPTADATSLQLIITNIKTDFNANDEPKKVLEFPFTFSVINDANQHHKK